MCEKKKWEKNSIPSGDIATWIQIKIFLKVFNCQKALNIFNLQSISSINRVMRPILVLFVPKRHQRIQWRFVIDMGKKLLSKKKWPPPKNVFQRNWIEFKSSAPLSISFVLFFFYVLRIFRLDDVSDIIDDSMPAPGRTSDGEEFIDDV